MKKLFTLYFNDEEKPIVILVLSIVILIFNECLNNFIDTRILTAIGSIFFLLAAIGICIAAMYQLIRKQWIEGITMLAIFSISLVAVAVYFGAIAGDGFADHLRIPRNISLEKPVSLSENNHERDSIRAIKKNSIDFQLYSSFFQPGIYEFDFWTGKIDSGVIYLKAIEVTEGYELSTESLPKSSELTGYNPSDTVLRFNPLKDFTIFEGDWEKPYAARFEVWFKPKNGGNERKLLSKNYIIEGWQR